MRPGHFPCGRTVSFPHDLDLRRVDAGGCDKPGGYSIRGLVTKTLKVAYVDVDGVDGSTTVCARRQQDLATGETSDVAVGAIDPAARSPFEPGNQILGSPHQCGGGLCSCD